MCCFINSIGFYDMLTIDIPFHCLFIYLFIFLLIPDLSFHWTLEVNQILYIMLDKSSNVG